MEKIEVENLLQNSFYPISIEEMEKVLFQMKNSVCKILNKNGLHVSGFFCKIPYSNEQSSGLLNMLITNYHMINVKDIMNNQKLEVTLNNDEKMITIKIDNSRIFFTSQKYDIVFIEIKPNEDGINDFFEISNDILKKNKHFLEAIYPKKFTYILHFHLEEMLKHLLV